jgi:hypothetical protein
MKKRTTSDERREMMETLATRFAQHPERHADIAWSEVAERLEARPEALAVLLEMERTGGEPDVVGRDGGTGGFVFFDCSRETPKGRTSVCYDRAGLESRKEHRPANTAVDMAAEIGIALLTEEDYRHLQTLGEFDAKTSSWVATPAEMRELGGALFGDSRYGRVFFYHNGAQSYYGSRGFRGSVRV